jgi:hypothetical protein
VLKSRIVTKEPKVIALSLELLDWAMAKCNNAFHVQIGTKDFLNTIISLLNSKNMPIQVTNIYRHTISNLVRHTITSIYTDTTKSANFNLKMGSKIRERQRYIAIVLLNLHSTEG